MPEAPDDFADTLRARLLTLVPDATTLARNPRSTVAPPRLEREGTRAAIQAFEEIGESLRARATRGLELERTLGEGGMGVVRLATQVVLGRKVAVKTLRDEVRSREATLDLLREAWITGGLEHPNVVPIYDVGMDDQGGPLVVLKRIEGVHWGEVMHDGAALAERFGASDRLEWNLRILVSVCNALAFAHSREIVHRDLKPENVMVGRFGEVYLLDWGIAVSTREDDDGRLPRASEANDMAGTPCYMAPEMLGGQARRIGPRSDVYLLGAVLFEVVTGKPPHAGDTMQAIVASALLSRPAFPEDAPQELAQICRRAMAREPEDRFLGVPEFRAAIEAFLEHRGSMLLGERANERRARLLEAIAEGASEDRLYDLLGECRFGYRAALASWSGNEDARSSLASALTAMAEHELARGEPHAAARLLRELPERPAELAARVAEAESTKDAEQQKLAALSKQLDKNPGSRTRVFVMVLMGVFWSGVPLYGHFRGTVASHASITAFLFGALVLLGAVVRWARESMHKTLVNKRSAQSIAFVMLLHIVIELAAGFAGIPSSATWLVYPVLWASALGMVCVWFEPRFWPSAVIALAVIPIVASRPDGALVSFAVFNLAFVVNVVWAWLPQGDLAAAEARVRRRIEEQHQHMRRRMDR